MWPSVGKRKNGVECARRTIDLRIGDIVRIHPGGRLQIFPLSGNKISLLIKSDSSWPCVIMSASVVPVLTPATRTSEVFKRTWPLNQPRRRSCKHPRLHIARHESSQLIINPSLYLNRAVLVPIWRLPLSLPSYRNHFPRCPRSRLCAKVVCEE